MKPHPFGNRTVRIPHRGSIHREAAIYPVLTAHAMFKNEPPPLRHRAIPLVNRRLNVFWMYGFRPAEPLELRLGLAGIGRPSGLVSGHPAICIGRPKHVAY